MVVRYCLFFLLLLPIRSLCQHAVVSATKMNVLYIGIKNPISFAVENAKCSELTLVVENGSAEKTSECEYDVMVTKPGSSLIFIIKGKDTLYRTPYRVWDIPTPVIREGNSEAFLFLDSLRTRSGLLATMENFNFDARFSIVSFDIEIYRNRKLSGKSKIYCSECFKKIENKYYVTEAIFSGKNKGEKFNSLLKDFIQNKLLPGDRMIIENIKVLGPDNWIRLLPTRTFRVQ
jgi:GldM C-terminal domain